MINTIESIVKPKNLDNTGNTFKKLNYSHSSPNPESTEEMEKIPEKHRLGTLHPISEPYV